MYVSMPINDQLICVDTATGLWGYLHQAPPKVQGILFSMIIGGTIHKAPDSLEDVEKLIIRAEGE